MSANTPARRAGLLLIVAGAAGLPVGFLLNMLVGFGGGDSSQQSQVINPTPASPTAPEQAPTETGVPPAGTGAPSGEALRFAVKGDFGDGSAEQAAVTERMCEWRESTGFTVVLTTGDNFYDPDGTATEENYHGPEECLYSDPTHEWRASWGNHDEDGESTATVLGAPIDPRYYTWTAGDVAFFAYDGNDADQAQREWLHASVCSSTASVKIVYGHQPPFSVGKHGSEADVQEMVHPVATECGVSLVLSGHDHLYERTHAIDGVTYIVTGGGGGNVRECETSADWLAVCLEESHFLYLEIAGEVIHVQAVDSGGEVIDSVEIPAGAAAR